MQPTRLKATSDGRADLCPARVLLIGYGALGRWVAKAAEQSDEFSIASVLVRHGREDDVRRDLPGIDVAASLDALQGRFDFALEVAGHEAVATHVPDLLAGGVETAIASTGALADDDLRERVIRCASSGRTRLRLLSGAIGGLDLLAAHRAAGISRVVYTGRKPPGAWKVTAGLPSTDKECLIFQGTAREAARAFPANANVAATIALAGAGLDKTEVRLVADPALRHNVHHVEAESKAGAFKLEMTGWPLADNPSTSALTAYSALRTLQGLTQPLDL